MQVSESEKKSIKVRFVDSGAQLGGGSAPSCISYFGLIEEQHILHLD